MQENDLHLPRPGGRGGGDDGRVEIKIFVPKSTQACVNILYGRFLQTTNKKMENKKNVWRKVIMSLLLFRSKTIPRDIADLPRNSPK